jgi:PPM family protein phosphatase
MSRDVSSHLQFAQLSSVGRIRSGNEDTVGHCAGSGIFLVCDGMGGAAAGEVASRTAVDAVLEALSGAAASATPRERVSEAIARANHLVHSRAAREPGLAGMGTTLVLLQLISEAHALIAHVGDSRCYLFRDRRLARRTADHSLVDEQMRLGQLTPEEAEQSPFRNVITRAIGTQSLVVPEISEVAVETGDLFLLCSDGLTRELSDSWMESILAETPDLEAACQRLVDDAEEAGGHDNITCLLVRIS